MNLRKIEKIIKEIIDGMYKHYHYIIENFDNIEGLDFTWGLSKIQEDGTKLVLIFMTPDNFALDKDVENRICSKINCRRENLIKIILISEEKDNNETEKYFSYLRSDGQLLYNYIILDLKNRNIRISDTSLEFVASQTASIIEHNTNVESHRKNAIVTHLLIGINIFMFIVTALLSHNFMDIDIDILVNFGAKYNPAIEQGQWFRLFTCMFLHGGLMHIAANMYSLYSIGPLVENLYGKYKFIGIYIFSGIIASLFSFVFSPYVSIGASGAIFGLMGTLFIFAAKERKKLGKDFFINIASTVAVNLYIGYSLPGIDNYAHLGGLLTGIISGGLVGFSKKEVL